MTGENEGRKVVPAEEILGKIERGESVEYENVIVEGDLDLEKIKLQTERVKRDRFDFESFGLDLKATVKIITSPIKIANSDISKRSSFANVLFYEEIDLHRTNFYYEVSFEGAIFKKEVNFDNAKFCRAADFGAIQTNEYIDFTNAQFDGNVDFTRAVFDKHAIFNLVQFNGLNNIFQFAQFKENVLFNDVRFSNGNAIFINVLVIKNAVFISAKFNAETNFDYAQFNGNTYFRSSQFGGTAYFRNTIFKEIADFQNAYFVKILNLAKAKFYMFDVEWDYIKDHLVYDGPVYLSLIKSFESLERFNDADNCYYQYRRISQNRKSWYDKDKNWLHLFNWSKLYDHVSWRSCGYGVRPSFTLAWIFGSILGFESFYRIFDGITKSSPPEISMNALNNSTLLFTFAISETTPSFWDCLYFSAISLTGSTPVGLVPIGAWKYAVMFESVLGYLFLALFIVVLARKLIR